MKKIQLEANKKSETNPKKSVTKSPPWNKPIKNFSHLILGFFSFLKRSPIQVGKVYKFFQFIKIEFDYNWLSKMNPTMFSAKSFSFIFCHRNLKMLIFGFLLFPSFD